MSTSKNLGNTDYKSQTPSQCVIRAS